MAAGVLKALRELGLDCPRDIALAAFDGFPNGEGFRPEITSVLQPCYEMGYKGVQLLIQRIRGQLPARKVHIRLDPELKARESTLQYPGAGRNASVWRGAGLKPALQRETRDTTADWRFRDEPAENFPAGDGRGAPARDGGATPRERPHDAAEFTPLDLAGSGTPRPPSSAHGPQAAGFSRDKLLRTRPPASARCAEFLFCWGMSAG